MDEYDLGEQQELDDMQRSEELEAIVWRINDIIKFLNELKADIQSHDVQDHLIKKYDPSTKQ